MISPMVWILVGDPRSGACSLSRDTELLAFEFGALRRGPGALSIQMVLNYGPNKSFHESGMDMRKGQARSGSQQRRPRRKSLQEESEPDVPYAIRREQFKKGEARCVEWCGGWEGALAGQFYRGREAEA